MATRKKRFAIGLLSGYLAIGVNTIYSFISIPLILRYVGDERYGVWMLALQVGGYISLLELGTSSAVARFLADHKDSVNGGKYGRLLTTSACVFATQGTLVFVVGLIFSWFAPGLFSVPVHMAKDFSWLLGINCFVAGASLILRPLSSPFWAFQRLDIFNACSSLVMATQLILLWSGLRLGLDVYALAYATMPSAVIVPLVLGWIALKKGYFPKRGKWRRPTWEVFKELFLYGRDGLLLALGSQLVNASQIIIVSKMLGLKEAAAFAVITKMLSMSQLLFHKIIESASPGLTEMMIRQEIQLFRQRFRDVALLTLSAATIGGMALACGNSPFISLWTSSKISSDWCTDLLLGGLAIATSMSRCFISLFGITKDLRKIRGLCIAEGIVFIPFAIIGASHFGIQGVLAASLLVHLAVTLLWSVKWSMIELGSLREFSKPVVISLLLLCAATAGSFVLTKFSISAVTQLIATMLMAGVGVLVIWCAYLPQLAKQMLLGVMRRVSCVS